MAKHVLTPEGVQICVIAESGEILVRKMRSVVDAMGEHLGPGDEDTHMDGLVCVMDDLVTELQGLQRRAHKVAVELRQQVQGLQSERTGGKGDR